MFLRSVEPPVKLEREVESAGSCRKISIQVMRCQTGWLSGEEQQTAIGVLTLHHDSLFPCFLVFLFSYFPPCRIDDPVGTFDGQRRPAQTPWQYKARPERMTRFSPSFMSCKLNLYEIDLAHEKPNNASEYEDQNVKEYEAKQVESRNSKVVNLLPLEVITLYVTCRRTVGFQGCQCCQCCQSCQCCQGWILFQHFVFTKVGRIRTIEDDNKTGEIGKGHDDPKALVDHQELSVLSQLARVCQKLPSLTCRSWGGWIRMKMQRVLLRQIVCRNLMIVACWWTLYRACTSAYFNVQFLTCREAADCKESREQRKHSWWRLCQARRRRRRERWCGRRWPGCSPFTWD